VVGRDDEFTPVRNAQFIHDLIPDATLAIVDGAAHLPNLERPAVVNLALRRFLADLPEVVRG
jgi:3-oxoadipate enol-lactonase